MSLNLDSHIDFNEVRFTPLIEQPSSHRDTFGKHNKILSFKAISLFIGESK